MIVSSIAYVHVLRYIVLVFTGIGLMHRNENVMAPRLNDDPRYCAKVIFI